MTVQERAYDLGFGISKAGVEVKVESHAVTFTDAGDLVGYTAHPYENGDLVYFSVITTTTGISVDTYYHVISATANTFQVSATEGGSAVTLTTNGTGTAVGKKTVRLRKANKIDYATEVKTASYDGDDETVKRNKLTGATATISLDCFPVGAYASIFGLSEVTAGLPDSFTSAYPLFTDDDRNGRSVGMWVEGEDTEYDDAGTSTTVMRRDWLPSGTLTLNNFVGRASGDKRPLTELKFETDLNPTTDIAGMALPSGTAGGPVITMTKAI